jgi:DHA1 family multidrug resistance protein-like MFS transporter
VYLTGIIGAAALIIDALFMNETFPPVFLIEKANELRQRTKNWGIYVIQEKIEIALGELLRKNFSRALMFLFTEPIVLCLSIYIESLYGLLYLFLTAYPIVFQRIHGFEKGCQWSSIPGSYHWRVHWRVVHSLRTALV